MSQMPEGDGELKVLNAVSIIVRTAFFEQINNDVMYSNEEFIQNLWFN